MVGKLNMPPVKGYLGTFEAVRKANEPIPYLDIATIGSLIQAEFDRLLPRTFQFRGIEKPENELDAIVEAGTDDRRMNLMWATLPPPKGNARDAVYHGYVQLFLSQLSQARTSSQVVAVIAYNSTELVMGGVTDDGGMYKFRTSPKAAFVALRYFHVNVVEPT